MWVFGYGSLAHTPNFAFGNRAEGYIRGYRRVFWQVSCTGEARYTVTMALDATCKPGPDV